MSNKSKELEQRYKDLVEKYNYNIMYIPQTQVDLKTQDIEETYKKILDFPYKARHISDAITEGEELTKPVDLDELVEEYINKDDIYKSEDQKEEETLLDQLRAREDFIEELIADRIEKQNQVLNLMRINDYLHESIQKDDKGNVIKGHIQKISQLQTENQQLIKINQIEKENNERLLKGNSILASKYNKVYAKYNDVARRKNQLEDKIDELTEKLDKQFEKNVTLLRDNEMCKRMERKRERDDKENIKPIELPQKQDEFKPPQQEFEFKPLPGVIPRFEENIPNFEARQKGRRVKRRIINDDEFLNN